MATTQEIISAAEKLGQMISTHETARKMEDVVKRLQADVAAQRTLNDYNRHLQKIGEKEAAGKAIEVDDKKQLEKLQEQVILNQTLREFQVAQMDYLDLMRRVEQAMDGSAGEAPPAGNPGKLA